MSDRRWINAQKGCKIRQYIHRIGIRIDGNDEVHHLGRRAALFLCSVFLPAASRTPCSSENFFFAYRLASASSTSSSTIVLFLSDLDRLSWLVVPKGVVEGIIVPIYTNRKRKEKDD